MANLAPSQARDIAARALRNHRDAALADTYGMALAERLSAGVLEDKDMRRLVRFHRVNAALVTATINEHRTEADSAVLRSFDLHGGEAGRAFAESWWKSQTASGAIDDAEEVIALLNETPAAVYDAFAADAWRYEYGLTPATAAKFVEDYQTATGTSLDYKQAFGESASTVANAIFRRYSDSDPMRPLIRALGLGGVIAEAARRDLQELLTEDLSTAGTIDEAFYPKYAQGGKLAAAKVAWPTVAAFGLLAMTAPKKARQILLQGKPIIDPTFEASLPVLSSEPDILAVYYTFLHKFGKHAVETPKDAAALDAAQIAVYELLMDVRQGKAVTEHAVRAAVTRWHEYAKSEKQNGTLFWTMFQAMRGGDWESILLALPEDSDMRPILHAWAKDGADAFKDEIDPVEPAAPKGTAGVDYPVGAAADAVRASIDAAMPETVRLIALYQTKSGGAAWVKENVKIKVGQPYWNSHSIDAGDIAGKFMGAGVNAAEKVFVVLKHSGADYLVNALDVEMAEAIKTGGASLIPPGAKTPPLPAQTAPVTVSPALQAELDKQPGAQAFKLEDTLSAAAAKPAAFDVGSVFAGLTVVGALKQGDSVAIVVSAGPSAAPFRLSDAGMAGVITDAMKEVPEPAQPGDVIEDTATGVHYLITGGSGEALKGIRLTPTESKSAGVVEAVKAAPYPVPGVSDYFDVTSVDVPADAIRQRNRKSDLKKAYANLTNWLSLSLVDAGYKMVQTKIGSNNVLCQFIDNNYRRSVIIDWSATSILLTIESFKPEVMIPVNETPAHPAPQASAPDDATAPQFVPSGTQEALDWIAYPSVALSTPGKYQFLKIGDSMAPSIKAAKASFAASGFKHDLGAVVVTKGTSKILVGYGHHISAQGKVKPFYVTKSGKGLWYVYASTADAVDAEQYDQPTIEALKPHPSIPTPAPTGTPVVGSTVAPVNGAYLSALLSYLGGAGNAGSTLVPLDETETYTGLKTQKGMLLAPGAVMHSDDLGDFTLIGAFRHNNPGPLHLLFENVPPGGPYVKMGDHQVAQQTSSGAVTWVIPTAADVTDSHVEGPYPFTRTNYLVPGFAWEPLLQWFAAGKVHVGAGAIASYPDASLADAPPDYPVKVGVYAQFPDFVAPLSIHEGTLIAFVRLQDGGDTTPVYLQGADDIRLGNVGMAHKVKIVKTAKNGPTQWDGFGVKDPATVDAAQLPLGMLAAVSAPPVSGPIAQPAFASIPKGKHVSCGVVAFTQYGIGKEAKILFAAPAMGFGGYTLTIPKGTVDAGESLENAAVREVWEETGAEVQLLKHLGDYEASTSMTRVFLGYVTGGSPTATKETELVVFADLPSMEQDENAFIDACKKMKWWSALIPHSKSTWQQKAVEKALREAWLTWPQDQEVDVGEASAAISVAAPTLLPPFDVPSLKWAGDSQSQVALDPQPVEGSKQEPNEIDYSVTTSMGDFTVNEYAAATLDDDADVNAYSWIPWSTASSLNGVAIAAPSAKGFPPPGAGVAFPDEDGAINEGFVLGYYAVQEGADTRVLVFVRHRKDDGDGDPRAEGVGIFSGGEWADAKVFSPLVSAVPVAAKAGMTVADAIRNALLQSPFPVLPMHATTLVMMAKSSFSTVTEVLFKKVVSVNAVEFHSGDVIKELSAQPAEIQGFIDVIGKSAGSSKAFSRSYTVVVSLDTGTGDAWPSVNLNNVVKEAKPAQVPGTYYGIYQHSDPEINAKIAEVGKGVAMEMVGFQILTFRKALQQAGFPYADVIPPNVAQVAASAFLPNGITKTTLDTLVKYLYAVSKQTKKVPPVTHSHVTATPATVSVPVVAVPVTTIPAVEPAPTDYAGRAAMLAKADPNKMKVIASNIGGSNPNMVLEDQTTKVKYLLKAAKDSSAPVRIAAEVAGAAMLGALSDYTTPVRSAEYNGKQYSMQPMFELDGAVPANPKDLSDSDKQMVLRQHALDMFVQDMDGHTSNWVMTTAGIRAIDKGRAFKPFIDGDTPTLALGYNKGVMVGKAGDVWYAKSLLKRYGDDHSVIPQSAFNALRSAIAAVQGVSDATIQASLMPLIEALKMPADKRLSVFKAIIAWRDNYLDAWTTLLKGLNPAFAWPSKVAPQAAPDELMAASPEQYGLDASHETVLKKTKAAAYRGMTLKVDRAAIEQQRVLVKEVTYTKAGAAPVIGTLMQWKVREGAGDKASKKLASVVETPLSQPVATSVQADPYAGIAAMLVDKRRSIFSTIKTAVVSVNKRIVKDYAAAPDKAAFKPDWSASAISNVAKLTDVIIPLLTEVAAHAKGKAGMIEFPMVDGVEDVAEGVYNMAVTYLESAQEAVTKYSNWQQSLGQGIDFFKAFEFDYDAWKKANTAEAPKAAKPKPVGSFKITSHSSMPSPITSYDPATKRLNLLELNGQGKSAGSRAAYKISGADGHTFIYFAPQTIGGSTAVGHKTFTGFCWAFVPKAPSLASAKEVLALFEAATGIGMRPASALDNEIRFWAEQATLAQNLVDMTRVPAASVVSIPNKVGDVSFMGVRLNAQVLTRGPDYTIQSGKITLSHDRMAALKPTDEIVFFTARAGKSTDTGAKILPSAVSAALAIYENNADYDEKADAKTLKLLKEATAKLLDIPVPTLEAQAKTLVNGYTDDGYGMQLTGRLGWTPDAFRAAMTAKNGGKMPLIAHAGAVELMAQHVPALIPTALRQFDGASLNAHTGASGSSKETDAQNGSGDRIFATVVEGVNQGGAVFYDIAVALGTHVSICGTGDTYGNLSMDQQNTPERWLADNSLIQSTAGISSQRQVVIQGGLPLSAALFIVPNHGDVTSVKENLKKQGITSFAFGRTIDEVVVSAATAKNKLASLKLKGAGHV